MLGKDAMRFAILACLRAILATDIGSGWNGPADLTTAGSILVHSLNHECPSERVLF